MKATCRNFLARRVKRWGNGGMGVKERVGSVAMRRLQGANKCTTTAITTAAEKINESSLIHPKV